MDLAPGERLPYPEMFLANRRAIAAHASQLDTADLVAMDEEAFSLLFGVEYYQLGWSRTGASLACGDDLFEGLP